MSSTEPPDDLPDGRATTRAPRHPWWRLVGLFGAFIGFTLAGLWWAVPEERILRASLRHFAAMPWHIHALIAALSVALMGAEMLRLRVMGTALGVTIGFRTALDATVANNFFSWLSPGAALGEPAGTFMLGRGGVPWDAAVVISSGKLAGSFTIVMGTSSVLVALGMGPPIPIWLVGSIAIAVGVFALLFSGLLVAALWPGASAALIDGVERRLRNLPSIADTRVERAIQATARVARGAVERLALFRRGGARGALAIVASHLMYHGVFIGILLTLAYAFDSRSLLHTLPLAIIYLSFLYIAPTPGGSGVGEGSANAFFGGVLPGGSAFVVVVLFRALTFYLHVLIGLVYLPWAGGLRDILTGRTDRAPPR